MGNKHSISFVPHLLKLHRSGLANNPRPSPNQSFPDDLPSIEARTQKILNIVNDTRKNNRMLFFVMYDIENNRVRRQVVNYLLRKGCIRVQKSVFLANTEHVIHKEIKNDLAAVQECYENNDSILIIPISTDYLQAMRIIGKNLDIDVILKNKNTLFF
ncbi:MAG: CRISPR-associated endonuclease Cas2 [Tannerellaceae bacterium]|jgi:CRISPR-associated protein Cas2|nr:CRISPR-associated endonuclease Cas2 [Tannerellaceae bacterium]